MAIRTFNIQAANEASLVTLLLSKGLLRGSENGWATVPGLKISARGNVALQSDSTQTALSGYFSLIVIDDAVVPNGAAIADDLFTNNRWTGAPVAYLLGVGIYTADQITRALEYAEQRRKLAGFRTPGAPVDWFPWTLGRSNRSIGALLDTLAALPDDAAVLAEDIRLPRLNRARLAITTKAQAVAIAAAYHTADIRWDRATDRLESAVEANPNYNWVTHAFPAGFAA